MRTIQRVVMARRRALSRVLFQRAVWSLIGAALWPPFYAGRLTFYPNLTHARLMIECFGGAFVTGFLGTAGPAWMLRLIIALLWLTWHRRRFLQREAQN
jgi:uncharacterized protein involved in response to NO